MIFWQRTIGIGLSLATASSLWSVALAAPCQEENLDALTPPVEHLIEAATPDQPAVAEELAPIVSDPAAERPAVDAPAAVTAVPPAVLENLSQEQIQAIAAIIASADSQNSTAGAALPTEVLTDLDTVPGLQQVGQRRRLPFGLIRRLRLPQAIASLIRQPKNAALVMLGNRILVVNPVTGAILGSVLSAL